MKKIFAALALLSLPALAQANAGLWISSARLATLPTSGTAYNDLVSDAGSCTYTSFNIGDQNATQPLCCFANALYYAKSGNTTARDKALNCVDQVISQINGSWSGYRALAIGRNLKAFPIVADLITLSSLDGTRNTNLKTALRTALTKTTSSGPANISDCAAERPQNWGCHCLSSVIAVDTYINDATAQSHLTTYEGYLKGFLGESGGDNSRFNYDTADICTTAGGTTAQCGAGARDDWQANAPTVDATFPHYGPDTCESFPSSSTQRCWGINASGATRKACAGGATDDRACAANADCSTCSTNADCDGTSGACNTGRCKCLTYNVDGVIPDDQRRDDVSGGLYGGFRAPYGVTYTQINYPWECMQGLIVGVAIDYNYHSGSPNPFSWGTGAVGRFFTWEYNQNSFPATGNDDFEPWLVNYYTGSAWSTASPTHSDRGGFGYTDYTHTGTIAGSCPACSNVTKDCTETDVDCGATGTSGCGTCADNKTCTVNADCTGTYCVPGTLICDTCAVDGANCSNTVKDCQEVDTDCGRVGSGTLGCPSTTCANTKVCDNNADCTSTYCDATLHCADLPPSCPACSNGVKDCQETDVNCGGGTCSTCANTKTCNVNADCTSTYCSTTCQNPPTTTTVPVTTTSLPASGCQLGLCVD